MLGAGLNDGFDALFKMADRSYDYWLKKGRRRAKDREFAPEEVVSNL